MTDKYVSHKSVAASDQLWQEFKEAVELFRTHQGPRLLALEDSMGEWVKSGESDLEGPERWFVYLALKAAVAKAFVEMSKQD